MLVVEVELEVDLVVPVVVAFLEILTHQDLLGMEHIQLEVEVELPMVVNLEQVVPVSSLSHILHKYLKNNNGISW
jgi:hypothetical protein